MIPTISEKYHLLPLYQKIASFSLLIGIICFLTGFFWQVKYSRLHTVYFILVVLPSLFLIPLFIKEQLHKNKLFLLVFIFCFYSLISVLWRDDFQAYFLFTYLKKILLLLVFFYAIHHVLSYYLAIEKTLFYLTLFCAVILAEYSISIFKTNIAGRFLLWGGLNDPISSAMVYGALFLLVMRSYLIEKNNYLLILYLSLAILFLLEILLTKSRGPLLAVFLSIPFLFVIVKPREYKRVFYPISLIIVALISFALFTDIFEIIFSRLTETSSRGIIWKDSINYSLEKPWFGYGLGREFAFYVPYTYSYVSHSHNFILSTWLYTGIPGVLMILAIIIYTLKTCYKNRKEDFAIFGVIIIFGIICLFVNGSYPISRANERWFVFWIPIAFIVAHIFNLSKDKTQTPAYQ
jgi:O-antigen ligase